MTARRRTRIAKICPVYLFGNAARVIILLAVITKQKTEPDPLAASPLRKLKMRASIFIAFLILFGSQKDLTAMKFIKKSLTALVGITTQQKYAASKKREKFTKSSRKSKDDH